MNQDSLFHMVKNTRVKPRLATSNGHISATAAIQRLILSEVIGTTLIYNVGSGGAPVGRGGASRLAPREVLRSRLRTLAAYFTLRSALRAV